MTTPNRAEALRSAAGARDHAAIDRLVARAGEPDDPFQLTIAAVEVKEAGRSDAAERLLLELLEADADQVAAWYELAVLQRLSGRFRAAVGSLLEARRRAPEDRKIAEFLVHMLHAAGAHPEARALTTELTSTGEEGGSLALLDDFGTYLQEHPRDRAGYLLDEVRRRYAWVSPQEVAARINAAMDERRGFSLVRMGDGEGAFARISSEDEARYPHLYASIRREWATLLFGADFDPRATGYASIVDTLMDVSFAADVVGMPYDSWIEHEYDISSVRGVPCLLNTHRALLARAPGEGPTLCNQRIHIELHTEGLVEPIIRRAGKLSVISCLSGLPAMLKDRYGLEEVELYKIPGEKYSGGLRSADQMEGVHFPFVYWDIVRRLSQPHGGRIFIIAAGTLAKFYAAVIKANGGIALDLGSLVDGWMKISSRPGYGTELEI